MRAAVIETAEVLRTDGAAVIVFDERDGATLKVHGVVGLELPTDVDDPNWQAAHFTGRSGAGSRIRTRRGQGSRLDRSQR